MRGQEPLEDPLGLLHAALRIPVTRAFARRADDGHGAARRFDADHGRDRLPDEQPAADPRHERVADADLDECGLGLLDPSLEFRDLLREIVPVLRLGADFFGIEAHHPFLHPHDLVARHLQVDPLRGRLALARPLREPLLDGGEHPTGGIVTGLEPGEHHLERRPPRVARHHDLAEANVVGEGRREVGRTEAIFLQFLRPIVERVAPTVGAKLVHQQLPDPLQPVAAEDGGAELRPRPQGGDELLRLRKPHHHGRLLGQALPARPQVGGRRPRTRERRQGHEGQDDSWVDKLHRDSFAFSAGCPGRNGGGR